MGKLRPREGEGNGHNVEQWMKSPEALGSSHCIVLGPPLSSLSFPICTGRAGHLRIQYPRLKLGVAQHAGSPRAGEQKWSLTCPLFPSWQWAHHRAMSSALGLVQLQTSAAVCGAPALSDPRDSSPCSMHGPRGQPGAEKPQERCRGSREQLVMSPDRTD